MDDRQRISERLDAHRQRLNDEYRRFEPNVHHVVFFTVPDSADENPPIGLLILIQHDVGLARPIFYN